MKKIISILISVCLILTVVVPSVFAYEPTTLSVSNIMQEDETYLVTVKGTCEPDSEVAIIVTVQDEITYVAIEQCIANSYGIFTKTFPIRNAGKYTAIVNNYKSNIRAEADFELYSKKVLDDAVAEFKTAADITEIQSCIEKYGAMFGFDTKYYTEAAADAVAGEMLALKNTLTKENIAEKFDEANLRAYIYELSTDVDNVIEYYDSLTSIVSSDVGMYADYTALDESAKVRVQETAFETPVENIADLCEKFYMAIVAEKAQNDTNTEFDEFISKYTEYLGIEGYGDISTIKKGKLLNAIKASEIPDNTEDFSELYKLLAEDKDEEDEGTKKPSTGGGGGGGGASGGGVTDSVITNPTGYENPESLNTPVPDASADISFNDMDGYEWAEAAVTELASKGIVNGKSKGTFAPGDYITREEFAKILVLAYGLYNEEADCEFTDISADRWSYKYIASSYGYGAINGYPDGSFGAARLITREEMAVMLYRVMSKQMKIEILPEIKTTLKDYDEISEYAKNSVTTLNSNGIVSGDESGYFSPQNNATRAEVCQMIYNSLNREGGRK